MEAAKLGEKTHHLFGAMVPDWRAVGKRPMEWDLNDWKWDGDLFAATPLNSAPSDCRSKQFFSVGSETPTNLAPPCLDGTILGSEIANRENEKRRRVVVVDDDDQELNDEDGSLNLKLGGQVYPVTDADVEEAKSGKKSKIVAATSNRAVCQVEDCRADLTSGKDYHRRHKVCEVHSKAARALVGNVMQRFCQQCSRFHVLQEFDEGKRSCRRRLAGHNRRRRKTHPENVGSGGPASDAPGSNYLLISLLRILSNLQTNNSDEAKDQDLLSNLLRNIANLTGSDTGGNIPGSSPVSQALQTAGTPITVATPEKDLTMTNGCCTSESALKGTEERLTTRSTRNPPQNTFSSAVPCPTRDSITANASIEGTGVRKMKLNNIDLNSVYDDSQDCAEDLESYHGPASIGIRSPNYSPWEHQGQKSSPPQTSGTSGSLSSLSPSSSSGEVQVRTDRIVFKLFGKDPSNFPLALRKQILEWLSNSPTDMESYIRPGCIVLTIYLRLEDPIWEELCGDLRSSLTKLLEASDESFWRSGWVYARVKQRVAFIYNGQVVLDKLLPLKTNKISRILSIRPIAVSFSQKAQFVVKGLHLLQSNSRLLCALEGKYLLQESCSDMADEGDPAVDHDQIQCLRFSCSIPDASGRAFVEVEDQSLSSSFFPFIVAERDVCSEIRTLETVIEAVDTTDDISLESETVKACNNAMEFIHEMGWLLHRNQLKYKLGSKDPNLNLFPFRRFRRLMDFSIEHNWCAVVKKLLSIVFSGAVDAGGHPSCEFAVQEMCLLHKAVRQSCRPMVEILLRYIPDGMVDKSGSKFLFKPDASGPGGLTPLHIVASSAGYERILDALTDDPESVGVEAWKSARDSTGSTPYDYACQQGYHTYNYLVQNKIDKKSSVNNNNRQVVVDIPNTLLEYNSKQKLTDVQKSAKVASFHTEKNNDFVVMPSVPLSCGTCQQKMMTYGRSPRSKSSMALYRPALLSMVAIAAVCVCVALLFKSSPEVLYVFKPFRWEHLGCGSS